MNSKASRPLRASIPSKHQSTGTLTTTPDNTRDNSRTAPYNPRTTHPTHACPSTRTIRARRGNHHGGPQSRAPNSDTHSYTCYNHANNRWPHAHDRQSVNPPPAWGQPQQHNSDTRFQHRHNMCPITMTVMCEPTTPAIIPNNTTLTTLLQQVHSQTLARASKDAEMASKVEQIASKDTGSASKDVESALKDVDIASEDTEMVSKETGMDELIRLVFDEDYQI
eukprot:gene12250-15394_t